MTQEPRRIPLSRERIFQAAIDVADREGLQALTMRRLGAELGVDSILGSLRSAGFSIDDAAHAFSLLDSYVYGHVVQEMSWSGRSEPREPAGPAPESEISSTEYPHLAEMTAHAAGGTFSFDGEFTHGLDVILSALEPGAAKDN